MSSTEKSDVLESLISLLEENEKRVDTLAKKIEENSDVFKSLLSLLEEYEKRADSLAKNMDENSDVVESILSLLEENEKRVDSLTKKIKIIEQKNSGNSSEIVNEKKINTSEKTSNSTHSRC